jgi:hypothetical protein
MGMGLLALTESEAAHWLKQVASPCCRRKSGRSGISRRGTSLLTTTEIPEELHKREK